MGSGGVFYRKVRAKVTDRPTGFVWVVQGKIAASGRPSSKGQVRWLARAGVGSILTLTESPLPAEWVDGMGLIVKHIPLKDHALPEAAAMRAGAEFVKGEVDGGRRVLVHCLAGEGRTGCILAAYLIIGGVGPGEALSELRRTKPEFVEPRQEKAVFEFASTLG